MSDDRWRDTYDRWLTTNPADEFLGPDPRDEVQARIEELRGMRQAMLAELEQAEAEVASLPGSIASIEDEIADLEARL